jgi:protein-S-isoprenylcysteine O-methyltransferase Ste14
MMSETVYLNAAIVAACVALGRALGVILGGLLSIIRRRNFVAVRFGWAEALTAPEPVVLAGVAGWLLARDIESNPSAVAAVAAVSGAVISLAGLALIGWTFRSWPGLFVGHAITAEHRLVTAGAYGVVRHPVYLAALVVWLGLGVAFRSVPTLLLATCYVLPAYLLYARSEEEMMEGAFGDAYRRYRASVPMILPRVSP